LPKTSLVFFKEADGSVPALDWLRNEVAKRDRRILYKIRGRLQMLRREGRDLRRPVADALERGIHELRVQFGHVNYRLLYFFSEDTVGVVSHGIVKESRVPRGEIDLAVRRRKLYETDPERYGYDYKEEESD
jgi:phage-related protein